MLSLRLRVALAAMTGLLALGRPAQAEPPPLAPARERPQARAQILSRLPVNRDQQCVGMTAVAEVLLQRPAQDDRSSIPTLEALAETIYRQLAAEQPAACPSHVLVAGHVAPVASKQVIDRLSQLVAARYQDDFHRMEQTAAGRRRLVAAQDQLIDAVEQLSAMIANDPDRLVLCLGAGERRFPDSRREQTQHAFLIGRHDDNAWYVYDANDPGREIACRVEATAAGVELEWTCAYQDQGVETTQQYLAISAPRYFQTMFGP